MLRELELKKPQLDELMQTAENLKSESNRHNLHGKGKYFKLIPLIIETNRISNSNYATVLCYVKATD